jgi:hypothetical protein
MIEVGVSMNFDPRLYVEIVPLENGHPPQPHPILQGAFDPAYVYKVLGIYNPSETSECFLMLANPRREIWFIPQRHTRAWKLLDGDELFVPKARSDGANGHDHPADITSPAPGRRSPVP